MKRNVRHQYRDIGNYYTNISHIMKDIEVLILLLDVLNGEITNRADEVDPIWENEKKNLLHKTLQISNDVLLLVNSVVDTATIYSADYIYNNIADNIGTIILAIEDIISNLPISKLEMPAPSVLLYKDINYTYDDNYSSYQLELSDSVINDPDNITVGSYNGKPTAVLSAGQYLYKVYMKLNNDSISPSLTSPCDTIAIAFKDNDGLQYGGISMYYDFSKGAISCSGSYIAPFHSIDVSNFIMSARTRSGGTVTVKDIIITVEKLVDYSEVMINE